MGSSHSTLAVINVLCELQMPILGRNDPSLDLLL